MVGAVVKEGRDIMEGRDGKREGKKEGSGGGLWWW